MKREGPELKSSKGGKIVGSASKTPTSKITKSMAEGRTAYTQSAMEGSKVPEKKFSNKAEQTRYMNNLSNRKNDNVTGDQKEAAYKSATVKPKTKQS